MKRKQLANRVYTNFMNDDKYKRVRLSLHFVTPSNKETATKHALLPMVLERGYEDYPDMTEFSVYLAELYGANLSANTTVIGENRIFSVTITGIQNQYALNKENLTKAYLDILLGVALRPALENGAFIEGEVSIEKQKLKELIQSEVNDKRIYCIRQAQRQFFRGSKHLGIEKLGYLEEVEKITAQNLYYTYQEMINTAQVEFFAMGCDETEIDTSLLKSVFEMSEGEAYQTVASSVVPAKECKIVTENIDMVQGKLCLVFTTGEIIPFAERSIMRVAISVFGAGPTSRLFMNVREKMSLCYYCVAGFSGTTSSVQVDSGVEHINAQKTIDAVLNELKDLVQNGPEEDELNAAKKSLVNALNSIENSQSGTESWYLNELLFGAGKAPKEVAEEIQAVTAKQVQEMLNRLSLSVQYILTKDGLENE